jgi:hypothetical protein
MRPDRLALALLLFSLAGCEDPGPTTEDASSLPDAAAPADDAATPADAAIGVDAGPEPDAGTDETCEQIAASITCSDGDRECAHRALGAYCATERTDVLRGDLLCIRAHSDRLGCRSFADPSGARDCIRGVHAAAGYASALPLAQAFATACGEPADPEAWIHSRHPPLAVLSDDSIAALMPCVTAAGTCTAAVACLAARYPEPYACF